MVTKADSMRRMRELFADEAFKARLLELHRTGSVVAGAPCPSGCGGTLRPTTLSYLNDKFELKAVNVLRCECGFQCREKEG